MSFSSNHRRELFLPLPLFVTNNFCCTSGFPPRLISNHTYFLLSVMWNLSMYSLWISFQFPYPFSFITSLINDSIHCILRTSVFLFQHVFVERFILCTFQVSPSSPIAGRAVDRTRLPLLSPVINIEMRDPPSMPSLLTRPSYEEDDSFVTLNPRIFQIIFLVYFKCC